jgi:superfamily II DNA or RNA helicase
MQNRTPPQSDARGQSAKAIRQLIAGINLFEEFNQLPLGGSGQATQLCRSGGLQSLSWINGGTELEAKVACGNLPFLVVIGAPQGRLQFSCSCRRGGGRKLPTLPCFHAGAVLLMVQALVKPMGAGMIRAGEVERLRVEFDGRSEDEPERNVLPGWVLVELEAGYSSENPFSYARHPLFRRSPVPSEVVGLVGHGVLAENGVQKFRHWLTQPSSLGLEVHCRDDIIPVERRPVVPLVALTELELGSAAVVLRRSLTQSDGESPGRAEIVYGSLVWLPAHGRFGWIGEESEDRLWGLLVDKLDEMGHGWAEEAMNVIDNGFKIQISPRDWNRLFVQWPPPGLRKNQLPALQAKPVDESEATLHLDISSYDEDSFRFDLRMKVRGEELDYVQHALAPEADVVHGYGYRHLIRSAERRQLLIEGVYRILAEPTAKGRAAIRNEVAEAPVFSRLSMGIIEVNHLLRMLEEEYCPKGKSALHVASGEEGLEWFYLKAPLARVARAILVLRQAVPALRPVVDAWGESENLPRTASFPGLDPADAPWDDDDDRKERQVLVAPKAEAMRQFAPLLAACLGADIELTFEEQAVETVRFDLSVRATPQEGVIDWFELTPEVTSDGSAIPQEHWEAWVKGQLMREADGRVRVIHPESQAAFEQFRQILQLQSDEDKRGKKRNVSEPLRVPRLRIFDWLALRQAGVRCTIPAEISGILESLTGFESIPAIPLPTGLTATLRPYQIDGYRWLAFLYRHRFGACLADDMGLGKTLQAITLLGAIQEGLIADPTGSKGPRPPHLIVLPPTLLFNWQHEIETFFPSLRVAEMTGANRSLETVEADIILTTYELARRDIAKLEKREFDVIVFDEAQAIKNLTASRSKAMRRLKGRFKVCLTGTPVENHAGEYYSILELALPGLFGDYAKFVAALRQPGDFDPLPRARPFVMRRTKEKILPELPPKVESDAWLELSATQKSYYTRAVAEVRDEVMEAFEDKSSAQAGIVALSALTRLRQICISPALLDPEHAEISPKIEHLIDKLFELRDEGHAALIFSQFTRALDLLGAHLKARDLDYLRIDGTTPMKDRKARVAAFQSGPGAGFFLISLKTGGVGLNLTRASYVFHLDPWWNPAVENQASDRAHRIGQTQHVFVQRLLMRHTVEEKMMLLKARKRALFDEVLGDAENRTGSSLLTREDMAWLLEG